MGTFNLDEARAARAAKAEAEAKPHELVTGGESYVVPPEMPARFLLAISEEKYADALRAVFNGQYDRIVTPDMTTPDLMDLIEGVTGLWGMTPGEAAASAASSSASGNRSRPTSKRTTG